MIEGKDTNKIHSVEMIPIEDIEKYGLSFKFAKLVRNDFPNAGSYMREKKNIGL